MSTISTLPPSTVRSLASAQVILTPQSIIKELVDNALDAGAKSIVLELDQTCIAHVLVRDDGSGISPGADRELMCLRYTTSKIERFEDLLNGRVSSYGFRGEALASLAEAAGRLEITTRTREEAIAERWTVQRNGTRASCKKVSAPPGTTIQASSIFNHLPVRREQFLKTSKKSLATIRSTLISYALLNRGVRITEKIVKSVIAPTVFSGGKTLKEAVTSCLGREVAQSSEFVERSFPDGWVIEAVLPKRTRTPAESKSASRKEFKHVVYAVDGRALSNALTTAKKLSSVTKKYLSSEYRGLICCNVKTPPEESCYDVNVEPGKDDVLFFDEEGVAEKWSLVVQEVYRIEEEEEDEEEEMEIEIIENDTNQQRSRSASETGLADETWMTSMHDNSTVLEALDTSADNSRETSDAVDEIASRTEAADVGLYNPWMAAKINKINRPSLETPDTSAEFVRAVSTPMSVVRGRDGGYMTPDSAFMSEKRCIEEEEEEVEEEEVEEEEVEEEEAEEEEQRPVHVHVNRPPPRTNPRLATVPKRRSFFVTDTEVPPLVIASESEADDEEEQPKRVRAVKRKNTAAVAAGKVDGRKNNSPHKNRQVAAQKNLITAYAGVGVEVGVNRTLFDEGSKRQSGMPLEEIEEGYETYRYLVEMEFEPEVAGTRAVQSRDVYWTAPKEREVKMWDGEDIRSLAMGLAGADKVLEAAVSRMRVFWGEQGWMMFG